MNRDLRPVAVEPMATLDEKHLVNDAVFEAMHITGVLFFGDGVPRTSDGALDRDALRSLVIDATHRETFLRQRLRDAPLKIMTPSWVPVDDIDPDAHIFFADRPISLDDPQAARILAGDGMLVDRKSPMWQMKFVDLTDGGAALILRLHHSGADGVFGSRVMTALCRDDDPARGWSTRAPRNGMEQLAAAGSKWYAEQGDVGSAWREYWRKPFIKRLRRWGGRLLRPVRNARIARAGGTQALLPERDWRMRTFDFPGIRRRAREVGLTVNDLLVYATLLAVLRMFPERESACILVPISRREGIAGDMRNHISVTHVTLDRATPTEEAARSVREQLAAAATGEVASAVATGHDGYASFLPWNARPQSMGSALVRQCTLWPATSPDDALAVFGTSYLDTFTLAITAVAGIDIDVLLERVTEVIAQPALKEAS